MSVRKARTTDDGRKLYFARRPFGYCGQQLDRGQVVALAGATNDARLTNLGYVVELPAEVEPFECRHCAARFQDLGALNAHGRRRHEPHTEGGFQPPPREKGETDDAYRNRVEEAARIAGEQADRKIEREAERLDLEAPIFLDKSTASRT